MPTVDTTMMDPGSIPGYDEGQRGNTSQPQEKSDFDKMRDYIESFYKPFREQRENAYNQINPAYTERINNPGGVREQALKDFSMSGSQKQRLEEALRAASNSASVTGGSGTLSDQMNQARIVDSLTGDAQQQWLKDWLDIQNTGLKGEHDIYNTTTGLAENEGSNYLNTMMSEITKKFQEEQQQYAGSQDAMAGFQKFLGMMLPLIPGIGPIASTMYNTMNRPDPNMYGNGRPGLNLGGNYNTPRSGNSFI